MNYNDAMEYIRSVGNFGSNYGLERTERILELLGNPHKKIKFIHIAGTNGKGSTTSMLSSILKADGYKVGMYTSPFIEEFEERIQINGTNIPKDILASLIDEIKLVVDKVIEEGYSHPTEFEIITCLMFLYFCREKVDFGVVEVGLGGRLDSTNVLDPILTVITSISLDHTNLLGNSIKEIAMEKAGIIKEGAPLILYPQSLEAEKVIVDRCVDLNVPMVRIEIDEAALIEINKERFYQLIHTKSLGNEIDFQLPLLGRHQILNMMLAIRAYESLAHNGYVNYSKEALISGIKDVKWKGRLEVLKKKPLVVIDGAHNIDGIKTLCENIKNYFDFKRMNLIVGILADKDIKHMLERIIPISNKVYAVTPNSIRAELAEDLKKEIEEYTENVKSFSSYEEAYKEAIEGTNSEDEILLVTGSLYMIGDMRKIIKSYK